MTHTSDKEEGAKYSIEISKLLSSYTKLCVCPNFIIKLGQKRGAPLILGQLIWYMGEKWTTLNGFGPGILIWPLARRIAIAIGVSFKNFIFIFMRVSESELHSESLSEDV